LSGSGVRALDVTVPGPFGDVQIDAAPVSGTATIAVQAGYGPVTASSVTVGGAHASDFAIVSDGCTGVPLGTSEHCDVGLAFDPSAVGFRQAVLVIEGPAPIGTFEIGLSGNGTGPASPVTWGSTSLAGPNYTWNYGGSLARTVDAGTQRLHLVYNTDRIGGKWAKDAGPYMGVYYVRSTSGRTWTTPKRLNPSTQHAERTAAAAAGSRVYAVWVSQKKVVPSPTAARVLYVRVNTDHGAPTKWTSAIRLSSTTGRVDYPSVAATGRDAYVVWTDAKTGSIKLAISHDRGVTWSTKSLGTTTNKITEGYEGVPVVSASGSTVAVAWATTPDSGIKVRTSSNSGATWSSATTLADTSNSTVSVAVRGTRVAVAWTIDQGVMVAVRTGATWTYPPLVLWGDGFTYSPAVVLQDPARVGIAYADADAADGTLRWIESPDNGVAWFLPQDLAVPAAGRAFNDWSSVIWPSAGTRIVAWNGWVDGGAYRQFVRTGSGTPGVLPTAGMLGGLPADLQPAVGRVSALPGPAGSAEAGGHKAR
jgi:hypothetical protein